MGRSPCCDKATVKRGPWSPDEDEVLKSYVQKYGKAGNWIALSHKAGLKRCGKSCRLRWLNYLRPDIKHGGFTEEEDNIICSLYIKLGSRWSVITSHLPGRTDNDVKNYWNTKLKKKFSATQNISNNPSISNTNNRIHNTKTESIDSSLTTPFMEVSTSILPTRQISFNRNSDSQIFFQDPNSFSCRGPTELTSMSSTFTNYSVSSASQEASTTTLDNITWSGLVGDELDSLPMDFGYASTYEDHCGYGYQVKTSGETPCSTSLTYPDFSLSDDNLEGLYQSVTY